MATASPWLTVSRLESCSGRKLTTSGLSHHARIYNKKQSREYERKGAKSVLKEDENGLGWVTKRLTKTEYKQNIVECMSEKGLGQGMKRA